VNGRRLVGALGVLAIAFGGLQVLLNWEAASPFGLAAFLVAVVILDDLILLPLALAVGWVVRRTLPVAARMPAQVALVVLAGIMLVGLPFALSPARNGESATLLTEPYWRNLGVLTASLAVLVVVAALLRRRRHDRSAP
jgi:hypothetical protein